MNNTEKALVTAVVTSVVLGVALELSFRQLHKVTSQYKKLHAWGTVTQKIMAEIVEKHPEVVNDISDDVAFDVEFYSIINKEDLF